MYKYISIYINIYPLIYKWSPHRRREGTEKIFEDIMTEKFSNLMRTIKP